MKNKGFTVIELLVSFVIIALIAGIGVISYNAINKRTETSYYKTIEENLLLSGNEYFETHREELPIRGSNVVSVKNLVDGKYMEPIKDKDGNTCTGGNVYIYRDSETNSYKYEVCLDCGDSYKSEGMYCSGNIIGEIKVDAVEFGTTTPYNTSLSYANVGVSSRDVSLTFSLDVDGNVQVSRYSVKNINTGDTINCDTNISSTNKNSCSYVFRNSGSYAVTAYSSNNEQLADEKSFNIKIDKSDPKFSLDAESKYIITDGTDKKKINVKLNNVEDDFGISDIKYCYFDCYESSNVIGNKKNNWFSLSDVKTDNIELDIESGSYTLYVEVTDLSGKVARNSVSFDISYLVKLVYNENYSQPFEVITGKNYGYLDKLPTAYEDKPISWYLGSTNVIDDTKVELTKEHVLTTKFVNKIAIPTAENFCKSPEYTGENLLLTQDEPIGVVFTNNVQKNVSPTGYTITAKLTDGYVWSDNSTSDKTFICNIKPKDLSAFTATLAETEYTYDENAKEPDVTIEDEKHVKITRNTDFTVNYANNTNVGVATVTITGTGNYKGTITKTFTIKKADIIIPSSPADKTFNRQVQNHGIDIPTRVVSIVTANSTTSATNVGTYNVVLRINDTNNYQWSDHTIGNKTITWKIVSKSINGSTFTVSLNPTKYTYDGTEKEPTVTVKDGDTILAATDYSLDYKNNKNVGTASVTINGIGNYSGNVSKNFEIEKRTVTIKADNKSMTYKDNGPSSNYSYTMSGHVEGENPVSGTANYTVKNSSGTTVTVNSELNAGTYTIIPSGLTPGSNYKIIYENGTLTVNRKPIDFPNCPDHEYIGSSQVLFESHSIGYSNNKLEGTNVDNYTVLLTPNKNYIWSSGDNKTEGRNLTCKITKTTTTTTLSEKTNTYNGTNQAVTGATSKLKNNTNVSGGTYKYTYYKGTSCTDSNKLNSAPKDAGTYRVIVTLDGTANYEGSSSSCTTYIIDQKELEASINSCSNKTYDETKDATCNLNSLTGVINGDSVSLKLGTCTFNNANVANNITVTCTVSLDGTSKDNYRLKSTSITNRANITQRDVTVTAPTVNASTLTYSGNTQNLLNVAGSCTKGGVMYWYKNNPTTSNTAPAWNNGTDWTTTKPTSTTYNGINAGTYYIWYYCYVNDTTNNKGTNINTVKYVSKNINKANSVCPTLTSYEGLSDNNSHTITATGAVGTINYGTTIDGSYQSEKPTRIEAGTTTVYVKMIDTTNYIGIDKCGSATIKLHNARIDFNLEGGTINNSGNNPIYVRKNNTAVYTGRDNSTQATIPTVAKTGYTFSGWYTKASGGNKVINADKTVVANVAGWTDGNKKWLLESTSDTNNTNPLYAQYTNNTYTINYYVGTKKVSYQTCTYNTSCTLKSFASLGTSMPNSGNGWSFSGWANTTSRTSIDYTDSKQFTYELTNNLDLYAIGRRAFRFSSGNAPTTNSGNKYQYWNTYGTSVTGVEVPTATAISGWNFLGYRATNDASDTVTISKDYAGKTTYNPTSTSLTAFDFRAIYQRNLTIKYDKNTGEGADMTDSTSTQYYNSGFGNGTNNGANVSNPNWNLKASTYTKTNYKFNGWGESSNATSGAPAGSYTWKPGVTDSATKTLYATWKEDAFQITIKAGNGISMVALSGWTNTGTSAMTKNLTVGSKLDLSTIKPTFKTGYSVVSYTKTSGAGSINGNEFTVGSGVTTITLNATKLANPTCTISGGTTKVRNNSNTELSVVNTTNYDSGVTIKYEFGYTTSSTGTLGNFATSTNNKYTIGKDLYTGTRYYGAKLTVTGDGGLTANCITASSGYTEMSLVNARIDFDPNGGTLSGTSPQYVAYGKTYIYTGRSNETVGTIPIVSGKTGYTWNGWYTTGGTKVINDDRTLVASVSNWTNASKQWLLTSTSNTENTNKLVAQYTANNYTVKFNSNSTVWVCSFKVTCPNGTEKKEVVFQSENEANYACTNMVFSSGGGSCTVSEKKVSSREACVLNSTTYADKQIAYDTVFNVDNPTCSGFTFAGWTASGNFDSNTAKYGTTSNPTTAWVDKNTGKYFKNLSTTKNGTVTLTANWSSGSLSFNNQTLNEGTYGTSYTSNAFTGASGGSGNYSYEIKSDAPAGATIDSENRIIRFINTTPAGTYNVVITVRDSNSGMSKDATMKIVINKKKDATTGSCIENLTYTGSAQTLANGADNASYSNNSGTSVNDYTVTVTANNNHAFSDGTTSKTLTCTISKAPGYVNLSATSGSVKYGTGSTTFTVSGSHGGTLSVSDNNNTATCTISGTTVTCSSLGSIAAGTSITVTVKSAATDNYTEGTKNYTLTINKADCKMTVSNANMTTQGTLDLTTKVSNAVGTVKFAMKTNGTTSASSLSGTNNKTLTAGAMSPDNDNNQSVVVTATEETSTNYNTCSKDITVTVQKHTRTLSWNSSTPAASATLTYGTSYSAVATASGSGGTAGSISYSSNNTNGATINSSSGAITVVNGNSKAVTITASMARTSTVKATSITRAFTTGKATGYVNLSDTSGSVNYGTASITFTVSGSHGGTLSVSDNNNTANCSISGSTVTCSNLGSIASGTRITVTVKSAATDNYTEGTKDYILIINNNIPVITLSSTSGSAYVGGTTTFNVKANVAGTFTVVTNNSTYATAALANTGVVAANTNDKVTVSAKSSNGTNASSATITVYFTPSDTTNWSTISASENSDLAKTFAMTVNPYTRTATFYPNNNTLSQPTGCTKNSSTGVVTCTCKSSGSATSCNITTPTITAHTNTPTIKGFSTAETTYSGYIAHNASLTLTGNPSYYAQTEKAKVDRTMTLYKNGNTSFTYNGTKYTDTSKAFTICTIAATHNGTAQGTSCSATITMATIEAPSATPTIIGWSTGANTRTKTYDSGQTSVALTMDANKSFYAQTSKAKVTLTAKWNANGATLSSTSNTTCDLAVVYNGASQATSCEATAPTITRDGFTIGGFAYNNANGTTSDINYNSSTNKLTLTSTTSGKTWHAITSKVVTATFSKGANTASVGTASPNTCTIQNSATNCTVKTPTITPNTGYTAVGWSTTNGATTGTAAGNNVTLSANTTYYGNSKANTYTVTLNKGTCATDGTTSVTATYNSATINPSTITMAKTTYTLSGFTKLSSATNATVSSTSNIVSTVTTDGYYTTNGGTTKVLAGTTTSWIANVSGFTDANKKWTNAGTATLYAKCGSHSSKALPTITLAGKTCGWTTSSTGTTIEVASGGSVTPTANKTYYGVCVDNATTITIKKDGKNCTECSGYKVALYQSGAKKYGETAGTGSTLTISGVAAGTYDIYASKYSGSKDTYIDTGVDITVSTGTTGGGNATATINYYTVGLSKGAGTTLTTKLDSANGTAFTNEIVVLGGNKVTIYGKTVINAGYYGTPTLKHGSTSITASGGTYTVNAKETIASSGATACPTGSITTTTNQTACTPCQPSGTAGVNGTTGGTGKTSCDTSCGKSNVSSWETASWSNGSVNNVCKIKTCGTGYSLSNNACVGNTYTATFYYYNGSVVTSTTTQCTVSNTAGNCSVTIPNSVTGSRGRYSIEYAGLSTSTGNMTEALASSAAEISLTANKTYYAIYRSAVNIYRPTSESVCDAATIPFYRNQWLTSTTAISTPVLSTSTTGTSNSTIPVVSGYTFRELSTSTIYNGTVYTVANAAETAIKTFYVRETKDETVTATFYYNDNPSSTCNTTDIKSITTNGAITRTLYCTSTSEATTVAINKTAAQVPDVVRNSKGTYNNAYEGLSTSLGNMVESASAGATSVRPDEDLSYYAMYRTSIQVHYPTGPSTASYTGIYRNQWFTSNSTLSTTVVTDEISGTNNMTSVPGLWSSLTFAGYSRKTNQSEPASGLTTVSSIATDCGEFFYVIGNGNTYTETFNKNGHTLVTPLPTGCTANTNGATCSCTQKVYSLGGGTATTQCSVTAPEITLSDGYIYPRWSSSSEGTDIAWQPGEKKNPIKASNTYYATGEQLVCDSDVTITQLNLTSECTNNTGLCPDETVDGRYVFRGHSVNNYLSFAGKTWRIMAIEPDGKLKIIDTTAVSNSFDSQNHRSSGYCNDNSNGSCNAWSTLNPANPNGASAGADSKINTYLNGTYYNNNLSSQSFYIASGVKFGIGQVSSSHLGSNVNLINLYNAEIAVKGSEKVSFPILSDLYLASSKVNNGICSSASNCIDEDYNWLTDFTLPSDLSYSNSKNRVVVLNPWCYSGSCSLYNIDYYYYLNEYTFGKPYASSTRRYYPTIYLNGNILISGGTGTSSNPFVVNTTNNTVNNCIQ